MMFQYIANILHILAKLHRELMMNSCECETYLSYLPEWSFGIS